MDLDHTERAGIIGIVGIVTHSLGRYRHLRHGVRACTGVRRGIPGGE